MRDHMMGWLPVLEHVACPAPEAARPAPRFVVPKEVEVWMRVSDRVLTEKHHAGESCAPFDPQKMAASMIGYHPYVWGAQTRARKNVKSQVQKGLAEWEKYKSTQQSAIRALESLIGFRAWWA